MTVGELFAGIGGIGLGLERAGMEVKWAIENDPYACAVYRKNFPHVQVIEQDITTVDFGSLEWVDLLSGGFPCQDISYAGKGAGIEGARSGLWKEFWRAIRILRPRLVLVENVPALLSRGLGCVLGDLAEIGYDAEWDCIPAAAVGAPHRRDRVFIVGHAKGSSTGRLSVRTETKKPIVGINGEDVADAEGAGWREDGARELGGQENAGNSASEGLSNGPEETMGKSRTLSQSQRSDWWAVEPDVGRVAHGVPSRVDRLRCLGNAVVPQVAEWIGRRIMEVYSEKEERRVADGG